MPQCTKYFWSKFYLIGWFLFLLSRKWTSPSRGDGGPSKHFYRYDPLERLYDDEKSRKVFSRVLLPGADGPGWSSRATHSRNAMRRRSTLLLFFLFFSSVRCIFFLLWHSNSITSENHILKNAHNPCSRMRNHGNVDTQPLGRCYELLFLQRPCRYHSIVCVGLFFRGKLTDVYLFNCQGKIEKRKKKNILFR